MELRQLRYFVTVAEELHFSRAAARLHLAQSALSAQIRRLEAEVGGPLLLRSTRQVELTPAGEALLNDGRAILAAADGALGRVRALARGGVLVVLDRLARPGARRAVLAAARDRFSGRHPGVRIDVRAVEFSEMISGPAQRPGRRRLSLRAAPRGGPRDHPADQ